MSTSLLRSVVAAGSLALLAGAIPSQAQRGASSTKGEINVPLDEVERLHTELRSLSAQRAAPKALEIVSRRFVGKFARGQLDGTLTLVVRAHKSEKSPIKMVSQAVAIQTATVDGEQAMPLPLPTGGVGLLAPGAGEHTLTLSFSNGRKEERFHREVTLPILAIAQTEVELEIDETDIDASIAGVILEQRRNQKRGSTTIVAALTTADNPTVMWRRRLTHAEREAPELEAVVHTLITPRVDLVRTQSDIRVRVVKGEADRVRIGVPPRVEISHVEGPAVLQWVTERDGDSGRTLVVLFKHLVADMTSIKVQTQAPVSDDKSVSVRPLSPLSATVRTGVIAIAGRAGFELTTKATGAKTIDASALPQSVIEMTQDPLLAGFTYEKATPTLSLTMKQNETIALTQALVDDLEAATVVTETGATVTKVRLTVRNTTQQHLMMQIPANAEVTHALIDGTPFTPGADVVDKKAGVIKLLIPLRQSEKVAQRQHYVDEGETLGAISLRYFNRTGRWRDILDMNGIGHPSDVQPGQRLLIPSSQEGQAYTESTFTLEVAYRVPPSDLDIVGTRDLSLPKLDLPVMRVAWHLYLPDSIEPLRFESNLDQLDGVRYDPLRRVRHFFDAALRIRGAWAGGGGYQNILKARKRIYRSESRHQAQEALSDFPLAGNRTRFRRVLLRDDVARIHLTYTKKAALPLAQAAAFLLMAFAVFVFARRVRKSSPRDRKRALVSPEAGLLVVVSGCLLYVASMVLGTHRSMLLGANAALLLTIAPFVIARLRDRTLSLKDHAVDVGRWLRGRTVLKLIALSVAMILVLQFPLLLSTFVLVVLCTMTWRRASEVSHA